MRDPRLRGRYPSLGTQATLEAGIPTLCAHMRDLNSGSEQSLFPRKRMQVGWVCLGPIQHGLLLLWR